MTQNSYTDGSHTYLFTYGTLMSDGPLNSHIKKRGGEYHADAVTARGWDMDSLSAYPIAARPKSYDTEMRILGEVWRIPWVVLPLLDQVEGSEYVRSCQMVYLLDQNDNITDETIPAQVFTAKFWQQPSNGPLPPGIYFHKSLEALSWNNQQSWNAATTRKETN